jgi:hypothetical protein
MHTLASTVLAQDHFYSDFLSSSLTILTHFGSMMMILICCGVESALVYATGGMNFSTTDVLNGTIFTRPHGRVLQFLLAITCQTCWCSLALLRNMHDTHLMHSMRAHVCEHAPQAKMKSWTRNTTFDLNSRVCLVHRRANMSLNQPKTATIAYIAIAPMMMHDTTFLLNCTES